MNLVLSAEWIELRTLAVDALRPFPEARAAIAEVLDARGGRGGGDSLSHTSDHSQKSSKEAYPSFRDVVEAPVAIIRNDG